MSYSNQHITEAQAATQGLQDLAFLQKRRLTIEFDQSKLTIYINKSFVPPVSWFLTDDNGELAQMGQIEDYSYKIDLSALASGLYYLRIAGEVHMIKN